MHTQEQAIKTSLWYTLPVWSPTLTTLAAIASHAHSPSADQLCVAGTQIHSGLDESQPGMGSPVQA